MIENVGRRSENWSEDGAPPDIGDASLNGYERNVLFWNRGEGQFVDVAYLAGANRIEDGRGVAVADFDRDGRLDLLLQNLEKPAVLLMGRGEVGRYLQVELVGTHSNRDALGAVVTARAGDRTQIRQVKAGSGFISSSSPVLHFGMADALQVDSLEVRWPSGERQVLTEIATNQRLRVTETREKAASVRARLQ